MAQEPRIASEAQREIGELEARMAVPQTARQTQNGLAELQARLAAMQAQMSAVQAQAGQQQAHLGAEQARLGRQQADLGKRQAALGAQQAAEAKRAEKKLEELIRRAQLRGLAREIQ